MKKIYCYVILALLLFSFSILRAQSSDFYLSPSQITVTTSTSINITVKYGTFGDSSSVMPDAAFVSNWRVNGKPNDPNLLPSGPFAVYMVPEEIPSPNPIAVSVDVQGDNDKEKVTLICNITVEDAENQIVIDGTSYQFEIMKGSMDNGLSNSNAKGMSANGTTFVILGDKQKYLTINFPGESKGTYRWDDKTCMVSFIKGMLRYVSLDPYEKMPTPGETIITEYGAIGEKIKGTFHGELFSGKPGYNVLVTGKFSVVHMK